MADGETVADPDWDSKDGHYRVRLDGAWIDVPDDALVTKPNLFGRTMVMDENILAALEKRWMKRFGVALPASNRQQAMVPSDCVILTNNHGSAPGIWLEDDKGRWVAMLPGVPREMRGMLADTLLPRVRDRAGASSKGVSTVVRSRTLRTANIAESALADRLGELASGVNGLSLAFLPGNEGVDLRVTVNGVPAAEAERQLTAAATRLRVCALRPPAGGGMQMIVVNFPRAGSALASRH